MNEINIEKGEQISKKLRKTGKMVMIAPIISSVIFGFLILIINYLSIFSRFDTIYSLIKLLALISVFAIIPGLMIGTFILFTGSMGKIARYQASVIVPIEKEMAPFTKEIIEANKDSIKVMAQSIGEGFEEAKGTRFCSNCGTKYKNSDHFCSNCGTKLN